MNDLASLFCSECNVLMGYKDSQPTGYIVCEGCHAVLEDETDAAREREEPK